MNSINKSPALSLKPQTVIVASWTFLCIVSIVLVWTITFNIIDKDRGALRQEAMFEANNRARSFAEQAEKNLAYIDQISLMLKYQWENDGRAPDIAKQFRSDLYLKALAVAAISAQGKVISAERPAALGLDMSDLSLFVIHSKFRGKELLINAISQGRGKLTGKNVIRFTRRVEQAGGRFDGIVLVSADLEYLAPFSEFNEMSAGDFLSLHHDNGLLLVNRAVGQDDLTRHVFKMQPEFSEMSGVNLKPASAFFDGVERYVAWHQLENYPIRAIASISVDNVMQAYSATEQKYKIIASALTALLMAAAVLLMMMQLRYAARKRSAEEVQNTFRLAIDGAREAFYMLLPQLDRNGALQDFRIEDCNERAGRMLGRVRSDLIGKLISQVYTPDDTVHMMSFLKQALESGFFEAVVKVGKSSAHKQGWFQGRAVRSGDGIAVTVRDITKLKLQEATLERMATTDALTLLPNRFWIDKYLPSALEQCRVNGSKMAIFFIDIDNFKKINDSQGHKAGDEVLVAVAKCLRESVRASDAVVRLGGDEFTIIIHSLERKEDLDRIADLIAHALDKLNSAALKGFKIHVSIGASVFPDDAQESSALLQAADLAMYAAKSGGKAQFRRYETQMAQHSRERIRVEQKLEKAIFENQLVLHFQPRASTTTGALCSMEALVRWQDPERGLISPADFIPIAEESNLILALGDWVARQACAQLQAWRDAGIACKPVSINVSARQLTSSRFRLSLMKSMQLHQIDHSLLAIELTESTMIGDDAAIKHELNELRAMGIELQIDDFGTGYSSLSQLQNLDIDVLKIDQSFVKALNANEEGVALCKAMISIGKTLKIIVVAEGIETPEQLLTLQLLGCDEVQGYLISPPVPAEKMALMLQGGPLFDPAALKLAS